MTGYEFSETDIEHRPGVILIAGAVAFFAITAALWAFFLGEALILKGIAIVAATMVGIVIFMEPLIGLCLMVFLVPVEEVRSFLGGWVTPTKVVGAITFVSFLINARLRRGMFRFDKQSHWMFAFAVWTALSFLWAKQKASVPFLVLTVGQLALFWVLIRASLRSPREFLAVSMAFIVGTLAGILIAAVLPRWGLAPRLMYTTGNPNHLARDIVVSLILLLYYAPRLRSWAFLSAIAAGAVLVLGLVLTQSRAVWLAAVFCIPLVLLGHKKAASAAAVAWMVSLALVMFSIRVLSAHLGVTEANLEHRWESIFHTRVAKSSRVDIWRAGIRLGSRYPILGVGAGGFVGSVPDVIETMPDFAGAHAEIGAHNTFLCAFAELGVVGLIVVVGILWHCGRAIAQQPRSLEKMVAWALFGSVVVRMVFSTALMQKTIWFTLALSQVILRKGIAAQEPADDALAFNHADGVAGDE